MTIQSQALLTSFLLPDAGVRGAHVCLEEAWREVQQRSDDAGAARDLLGQALAASALLMAHVKVDGRLSVQLRASAALRSLFVECTAGGTLRGLVRLAEETDEQALLRNVTDLASLGRDAVLAITIENPGPRGEPTRYQGLVPLESARLDAALQDYFQQSEQLPTCILLAANAQRACGLLLQKLPGSEETDDDGWQRVQQLFATLGDEELLQVDGQTVLHRLFHQESLQWLGERSLAFGCSCSRARVEDVLRTLGEVEAHAAVDAGENGQAVVRCEFCAQRYRFDHAEIDALFRSAGVVADAPERLQ